MEIGNCFGSGSEICEEKREWRLPALSYADVLVLCGDSEENLRDERRFSEVLKK